MKKAIRSTALAAAALLFVPSVAMGASQIIESTLTNVQADVGGEVWLRYFMDGVDTVNPVADQGGCNTQFDPTDRACLATFRTRKKAYRAYSEDLFNYGLEFGAIASAIWDHEANPGTPNHVGYYRYAVAPVNDADSYDWKSVDCTGTTDGTCLGPCNPQNTKPPLSDVPTPGGADGAVGPVEALDPIPIPRVSSYDKVTGDISLNWDAATSVGALSPPREASYELNFATDSAADGACNAPAPGAFGVLRVVAGTSTVVNVSELGLAPGDEQCVTFAIRLVYPNPGATADMMGRYLSANGQAVYIGAGGLSSDIYDLVAKPVRGGVEVSWKTSLEDGVRGFYVARAFAVEGPYQRVSDLIAAHGEPSSYTFIDRVPPQLRQVQGANGLFYRIESLDIDDQIEIVGPVEVELPQQAPAGTKAIRPRF